MVVDDDSIIIFFYILLNDFLLYFLMVWSLGFIKIELFGVQIDYVMYEFLMGDMKYVVFKY